VNRREASRERREAAYRRALVEAHGVRERLTVEWRYLLSVLASTEVGAGENELNSLLIAIRNARIALQKGQRR
jgi:hypothetical protein